MTILSLSVKSLYLFMHQGGLPEPCCLALMTGSVLNEIAPKSTSLTVSVVGVLGIEVFMILQYLLKLLVFKF